MDQEAKIHENQEAFAGHGYRPDAAMVGDDDDADPLSFTILGTVWAHGKAKEEDQSSHSHGNTSVLEPTIENVSHGLLQVRTKIMPLELGDEPTEPLSGYTMIGHLLSVGVGIAKFMRETASTGVPTSGFDSAPEPPPIPSSVPGSEADALSAPDVNRPAVPPLKPARSILKIDLNEGVDGDDSEPRAGFGFKGSSTPTVAEIRTHRRQVSKAMEFQARRLSQPSQLPGEEAQTMTDGSIPDQTNAENPVLSLSPDPPDCAEELVVKMANVQTRDQAPFNPYIHQRTNIASDDPAQPKVQLPTFQRLQSFSAGERREADAQPKHPICYFELKSLPHTPVVQIRTTRPSAGEIDALNSMTMLRKTAQQVYGLEDTWTDDRLLARQRILAADIDMQPICSGILTTADVQTGSPDTDTSSVRKPTIQWNGTQGLFGDSKNVAAMLSTHGLYHYENSVDAKLHTFLNRLKTTPELMKAILKEQQQADADADEFPDTANLSLNHDEPLWVPSVAFPIVLEEVEGETELEQRLFEAFMQYVAEEE